MGFARTRSRSSGSLATFTSRTILPVSSTMQTLVSLTDTSSPAEWSILRFSFCCLRPRMRTSLHHQPEAQHPKSPAIYTPAGRLPHLCSEGDRQPSRDRLTQSAMCGRLRDGKSFLHLCSKNESAPQLWDRLK